jgi:damage-control phosphatase, subfamily I
MKLFLDCLPCMLRQVLDSSRMVTDNPEVHEKIMQDAIKLLRDYNEFQYAPALCEAMHKIVKKHTGASDPYAQVKERDIETAKKVWSQIIQFNKDRSNTLYWALKTSATGNMMDSALYSNLDLEDWLIKELEKPFSVCDLTNLEEDLKIAKSVLIIGDNAGETVFDKVLVQHLHDFDVTYAVRNEPIINDVTLEDAYTSGMDQLAKIVSTGCNAPGAILEQCSQSFIDLFRNADIVISKGQGNFEALAENERKIYFLLKAKCSMIAQKLHVGLNEYAFKII